MMERHALHVPCGKIIETDTPSQRKKNGTAQPLPGFAGTDARDDFVFADKGADQVGAHVAELGHEDEIKDIENPRDTGEKIDFLDKIEKPGDVHQAQESERHREKSLRVILCKELAHTESQKEEHEKSRFKIIGARGGRVFPPVGGQVVVSAPQEDEAVKHTHPAEAEIALGGSEFIKLQKSQKGKGHQDQDKKIIPQPFTVEQCRREDHRPKKKRTDGTIKKDLPF